MNAIVSYAVVAAIVAISQCDVRWSAKYLRDDGEVGLVVNSRFAYYVDPFFNPPVESVVGSSIKRCDERIYICAELFDLVYTVPQMPVPPSNWDVGGAQFKAVGKSPDGIGYVVSATYRSRSYTYTYDHRRGLLSMAIPGPVPEKALDTYHLKGKEGFLSSRFFVR